MAVITIDQAETQFSSLIARAEAGEEIVIARGTEPAVRLIPVERRPRRESGRLKGKVQLPDEFFFDPLPEEEWRLWEGADDENPA